MLRPERVYSVTIHIGQELVEEAHVWSYIVNWLDCNFELVQAWKACVGPKTFILEQDTLFINGPRLSQSGSLSG